MAPRVLHPVRRLFIVVAAVMLVIGSILGASYGLRHGQVADAVTGCVIGVLAIALAWWTLTRSWVSIEDGTFLLVRSPFRGLIVLPIADVTELVVPERFLGRMDCPYVVAGGKAISLWPLSSLSVVHLPRPRVCIRFLAQLDEIIDSRSQSKEPE